MSSDVLKSAASRSFRPKSEGRAWGSPFAAKSSRRTMASSRIEPRDGGGTNVSFWLPGQGASLTTRTGRLTLEPRVKELYRRLHARV